MERIDAIENLNKITEKWLDYYQAVIDNKFYQNNDKKYYEEKIKKLKYIKAILENEKDF